MSAVWHVTGLFPNTHIFHKSRLDQKCSQSWPFVANRENQIVFFLLYKPTSQLEQTDYWHVPAYFFIHHLWFWGHNLKCIFKIYKSALPNILNMKSSFKWQLIMLSIHLCQIFVRTNWWFDFNKVSYLFIVLNSFELLMV